MNRRYTWPLELSLTVLLMLVVATSLFAADKPPKLTNVQGRIQMLDKTASSITVDAKGVMRKVLYDSDTKFLYGHSKNSKPGSAEQLKESEYISCAGTYDDKTVLRAKECVYRETR